MNDHSSGSQSGILYRINSSYERVMESNKKANLVIIVSIMVAAAPIFAISLITTRAIAPVDAMQAQGQESIASGIAAQFLCARGRSIGAIFSGSQVQLSLSDGREITIPQTRSGSGARYANPDESFVFWNKGTSAFITESGKNTYDNCVSSSN